MLLGITAPIIGLKTRVSISKGNKMVYKDKEKQKQANKEAARRRRAKLKGITIRPESHTVIPDSHTQNVIPNVGSAVIPKEELKPQSHSPILVGYVPPGSRRSPQLAQACAGEHK